MPPLVSSSNGSSILVWPTVRGGAALLCYGVGEWEQNFPRKIFVTLRCAGRICGVFCVFALVDDCPLSLLLLTPRNARVPAWKMHTGAHALQELATSQCTSLHRLSLVVDGDCVCVCVCLFVCLCTLLSTSPDMWACARFGGGVLLWSVLLKTKSE